MLARPLFALRLTLLLALSHPAAAVLWGADAGEVYNLTLFLRSTTLLPYGSNTRQIDIGKPCKLRRVLDPDWRKFPERRGVIASIFGTFSFEPRALRSV